MNPDVYTLLVFFHILLLVFWVGTDLGVFLAAKISERPDLSLETRSTVLKLGMLLDRLPRSALVLIIPSGLQLGVVAGYLSVTGTTLVVVWIAALVWLGILWAGFLNSETVIEKRAMLINLAINALLAVSVTVLAIYLLMNGGVPDWIAWKLLMVGLIFVAGVTLDILFKPAVDVFIAIMTEGATDERNAAYSGALRGVYWVVIAIYMFALAAAYLGIAK